MTKQDLQTRLTEIKTQIKAKEDSLKKIKKAELITVISTFSLMIGFSLLIMVSPLFVAGVLVDVFLGTMLARIMEGHKDITENEIKHLNIDARYIQRKIVELEKEEFINKADFKIDNKKELNSANEVLLEEQENITLDASELTM